MLITELNKKGDIRRGEKGIRARLIQICLKNAGYDLGKFGPKKDGIDDSWGGVTDKAFRAFQKVHGLRVDGWAGKESLYELMWYYYPHFRKEEFKCKCGGKYCNGYPVKVDENLIVLLEAIRKEIGNKPINLNSGIRCNQHNKNVGGSPTSQHKLGKASDIRSSVGVTKVWQVANKLNTKGGVGRYKTFTHVDVRGRKTRFDYR